MRNILKVACTKRLGKGNPCYHSAYGVIMYTVTYMLGACHGFVLTWLGIQNVTCGTMSTYQIQSRNSIPFDIGWNILGFVCVLLDRTQCVRGGSPGQMFTFWILEIVHRHLDTVCVAWSLNCCITKQKLTYSQQDRGEWVIFTWMKNGPIKFKSRFGKPYWSVSGGRKATCLSYTLYMYLLLNLTLCGGCCPWSQENGWILSDSITVTILLYVS